jgi:hypothetical protein
VETHIKELLKRQFGELNDFMFALTERMLEAVCGTYGEDALAVVEKTEVDLQRLYRWHIVRILADIDALSDVYGSEVIDVVAEKLASDRFEQGARLARELGTNTLEDYIAFTTRGDGARILESNETGITVRTGECFAGRIGAELGRGDVLFRFHCKTDHDFLRGFNPMLRCEHIKTLMNGDDCCAHRYYVEE